MQFQTAEQFESVVRLLQDSELEEFHLEPGTSFGHLARLITSRPPERAPQSGLVGATPLEWVPCCLRIRAVRQVIVREMPDSRPEWKGLLRWEQETDSGVIHVASAHGLRVEIWVERLEGSLDDLE